MKKITHIILALFLVTLPVLTQAAADDCKPDPDMVQLIKDMSANPELARAIKQKPAELAKVWKDLEESNESELNDDPSILHLLLDIPEIDNDFAGWFDKLSVEQVDLIWKNGKLRRAIEKRLRHPGGMHEWCMVCRAPTFKRWGVTVAEIHAFRTRVEELVWVHPDDGKPGGHDASAPGGKHGSTKFHNELRAIIDKSNSLSEFNTKLEKLRLRWKIDKSLLPSIF